MQCADSMRVPGRQKAWVRRDPDDLNLIDKDVSEHGRAEATLVVTAGTLMQGIAELGRPVAKEGTAVIGPGPIGFLAVAKSLGASRAVPFGTHGDRNRIGPELLRTFSYTSGPRTRLPA
ncbi:MAG: hypothetical protein F4Z55_03720 [Boseongicola sp. SB0667_bin_21]|nr:hypothetical protein [Boseongicola sp.]MXW85052.1 hypothetical protein [Boseongicola sp. SB0667_bin_21]